jgi:hypothetical protein
MFGYSLPSGGEYPPKFSFKEGYWYDSWGLSRNYYGGKDGYVPGLAYETLGSNKDVAHRIGELFLESISNKVTRAVEIMRYVQRSTDYGYDANNVRMNGVPQEEWAWNADETAHKIDSKKNAVFIGDCEDIAFLAATIYIASGIDAAIVVTKNHVALIIWLPEYPNANAYWDIPNDGRGKGWIWVEATGERNNLGWTPPDFWTGIWEIYPLVFSKFNVDYSPKNPEATDQVEVTLSVESTRSTIGNVTCHYSTKENKYTSLNMDSEDSKYTAKIPENPEGTTVSFYVSAADVEGFKRESETFEYRVGRINGIPGFPYESIIMGLILGIIILSLWDKFV